VRILVVTSAFCRFPAANEAGARAFAQITAPSATDVISLSAIVTDAQGRAITGLALKDFRVLEDQVEEAISSVKENTVAGDYTLTYAPKNRVKDARIRKIRVEIPTLPQLTVRHGYGYIAQ
jgi:hypothetical protein